MKVTKAELKQIIKEEAQSILNEKSILTSTLEEIAEQGLKLWISASKGTAKAVNADDARSFAQKQAKTLLDTVEDMPRGAGVDDIDSIARVVAYRLCKNFRNPRSNARDCADLYIG